MSRLAPPVDLVFLLNSGLVYLPYLRPWSIRILRIHLGIQKLGIPINKVCTENKACEFIFPKDALDRAVLVAGLEAQPSC